MAESVGDSKYEMLKHLKTSFSTFVLSKLKKALTGRNRYLDPVNFSKEVYLEFNLGPLFLLEDLVNEVFELKKKQYIYKEKPSGNLSTHFSRLADATEGSSVRTYRNRQVEKAHVPLEIWKESS